MNILAKTGAASIVALARKLDAARFDVTPAPTGMGRPACAGAARA
jgi:hypothetical protein